MTVGHRVDMRDGARLRLVDFFYFAWRFLTLKGQAIRFGTLGRPIARTEFFPNIWQNVVVDSIFESFGTVHVVVLAWEKRTSR